MRDLIGPLLILSLFGAGSLSSSKAQAPLSPERIISLAPSITDTLFALGLDKEIVGLTSFCDHPKAKGKERIGSYVRPNIEKIIALKPDIVIATAHQACITTGRLEELGIPVFAIDPEGVKDSIDSILNIGRITGREREAEILIARLEERIKAVIDRLKGIKEEERPLVFWQVGNEPLVTVGPKTFADDLIRLAKGRNIAEDSMVKYPRWSLEMVLVRNPDVIIVVGMTEDDFSKGEIKRWQRWKRISAVKKSRIHKLPLNLVTRPGSPRVAEALEEVASILHPELFKERE